MAVQNNFATGTDGLNYKPNTYAELGDMIGKIAEQVIRMVEAQNPLSVFDKMPINNGDTIEQAVIKHVEAEAYDKTGANALTRSTKKKMVVRYFNNWERRKYQQTVDVSELRKVLQGSESAESVASKLVSVLSESRIDDKFQNYKALLKWAATNGSLTSSSTIFKNVGDVSKLSDGTLDYKSILKKIKDTVKGMQFVNSDFNTVGLRRRTKAEDIIIIAPYTIINALDVDELAGVFNLSKAEIKVKLIEIDSADTNIYIVDRYAVLGYTRLYEMMNQPNADGLFYNYFLHAEDLFAVSPLFDGCYFDYAKATA